MRPWEALYKFPSGEAPLEQKNRRSRKKRRCQDDGVSENSISIVDSGALDKVYEVTNTSARHTGDRHLAHMCVNQFCASDDNEHALFGPVS